MKDTEKHPWYQLALVTGASSGLGLAIAKHLNTLRIPVVLVARNRKALETIASGFSVPTHIINLDLCVPKEREQLLSYIHQHVPDLVFNNAGSGLYGPVLSHPVQEHLEMIELNINALVAISLESATALQQAKRRGTIVNVSSAAAFFPFPTFATYAATKGFVNQFSLAFDEELKGTGIRILTVCPGSMKTSFQQRASKGTISESPPINLSMDKAVHLIFQQIAKRKSLSVIDWRYKLFLFLSRFASLFFIMRLLKRVFGFFLRRG